MIDIKDLIHSKMETKDIYINVVKIMGMLAIFLVFWEEIHHNVARNRNQVYRTNLIWNSNYNSYHRILTRWPPAKSAAKNPPQNAYLYPACQNPRRNPPNINPK